VAGALGPTNRTLSLSPRTEDPGYRAVTFDEMRAAYAEQARGLLDGGVDVLLCETVFDTLNLKACLCGIEEVFEAAGGACRSCFRSRSPTRAAALGQTLEAFFTSVEHARPLSVGINCALGARRCALTGGVAQARVAGVRHLLPEPPRLPNPFGAYDETPAVTSSLLGELARAGS